VTIATLDGAASIQLQAIPVSEHLGLDGQEFQAQAGLNSDPRCEGRRANADKIPTD